MINANDLRIDNLVYYSYDGSNYMGKITSLNKSNATLDNKYSIKLETKSRNKISPIPLTEEILLKCGAIYDDSNDTYWFNISPLFYIELIPQYDNIYAVIVGSIDPTLTIEDRSRLIADASSLHELQNLYFVLTKTELKITL